MALPADLDAAIEEAWQRTRAVPGFLSEGEARFLGLVAACAPARGVNVEIGSFKGRSTVALASVAARYGTGLVVSIDPHTEMLAWHQSSLAIVLAFQYSHLTAEL